MANDERSVFESVAPIFTVRNLPEALAFYTDQLEFEIGWTWEDPPTYASVCRDRVEINLGLPPAGELLKTTSVYIALTQIDPFHDRIVARGVTVTVPIGDRAYGMRDFTVVDPSGNSLSFGQARTS